MSSRYQELVGVLCESGQNNEAKNLSQSSDLVSVLEATDDEEFYGFLNHLKGIFWESSSEEWRYLPRARYIMSGGLHNDGPTKGYQIRLAGFWTDYNERHKDQLKAE